jgi:acyl-CoA synthetase (NDP forming)
VQDELREFIPIAGTSVRNPVDATFGRDRPLDFAEDRDNTVRMFEVIAKSHSTDVIFTTVGGWRRPGRDAGDAERERHLRSAVDELADIQQRTGVPIVMIHDEHDVRAISQHAHQRGIALLPTVDRAAKAVADLLDWRARREGLPNIL